MHLVVGAAVWVGPRQGARRAGRERGRAVPLFPPIMNQITNVKVRTGRKPVRVDLYHCNG